MPKTSRLNVIVCLAASVSAGESQALDFWWSKPHTWRYHRQTNFGHYQTRWRSWDEAQCQSAPSSAEEVVPGKSHESTKYEVRRSVPPLVVPVADPMARPRESARTTTAQSWRAAPAEEPSLPIAIPIATSATIVEPITLPPAKR